ncbi:MAG: hypothetical protein R2720_06935 [Candidatus Nanopelagicales bacterium]
MNRSRSHLVFGVLASALLLSACSSGETTSTTSPPPSAAGSSAAPVTDEAAFCQAALDWAQSPGSAAAQAAAQSGDVDALVAAYQSWAAPTQAMVDAVPADAPPAVQRAFRDLNDSVQAIAEEGAQSQKQADAYGAAQEKVLDYYGKTCG